MPETNQQLDNDAVHKALAYVISAPRLRTYLNAAGYAPERALALYLWNAKLGEAFHLPIQTAEVCVRPMCFAKGHSGPSAGHLWRTATTALLMLSQIKYSRRLS